MGIVKVGWADFKTTHTTFNEPPISYLEETNIYDIWMFINGREYIHVINKLDPAQSANKTDFENNYKPTANSNRIWTNALVTSAGELKVATPAPGPPAGTTTVEEGGEVTVVKQGGTNEYNWVIPSGETFKLQSFEFGGYIPKDGDYPLVAKGELWWQPNGSSTGESLVDVIYLQHLSAAIRRFDDKEFVGDGTARMQMELTNWSIEDGEFFRLMRGYY